MAEALRLGRLRKGRTAPNPAVGGVLVAGKGIVGRGYHRRAGEAHAEIVALGDAGARARGATLYVTLEPCVTAGRTPPCVPQIVAAGVGRVVIGTLDPHPRVAGRGAAALRRAGVKVAVGVREREARHLIEDYAKALVTGRPWVTAKFAASLDGKIATRIGQAEWISGPEARRYAHRLRAEHAAVAVGAGTLRADDPRLTVRLNGQTAAGGPVRLIIASRGIVPAAAALWESPDPPVWVACTRRASRTALQRLTRRRAEIIMCREDRGRVALPDLLEKLCGRGITSVLVEGGEELHGAFFDGGLVDRLVAAVAPVVIGGRRAKTAVGGEGVARVGEAYELREVKRRRLGADVVVDGYLTEVDDFFARVAGATRRYREKDGRA
jgi:diaminohydroxyphosphoribosylaminopyrimidine deaminase/5-amino-6-(5-phosphoribosylamino)uracil reductase